MTKMPFAVVAALAVAVPVAATDDVKTEAATAEAFFQVLKDRPDEAEKVMAALVQDHPTAEAWAARTRVQLRVGNVDGATVSAAEALKAAVAAPPQARAAVAEAHALLGEAYRAAGNAKNALTAYSTAVELAPDDLGRRATYGLLLGIDRQHEAGVAELKRVTADAAYKDVDAWVNLGWVYRNMFPPRTDESVAAYEMALRIDPTHAEAALGLGWAHLTATRYDLARAAFTRAIDLAPGRVAGEAYKGIGWSYFFMRDFARAREAAQKAEAAGAHVADLQSQICRWTPGCGDEPPPRPRPASDEPCRLLLQGGAAGSRAAADLGRMGANGVQCLVYAVSASRNVALKQAAASALGNIGGAARSACPHLSAIARGNPYEQTVMDAKTQQLWNQWEDLRRAAKEAMGRIGC